MRSQRSIKVVSAAVLALALAAVFAGSALGAGAPRWKVGGSFLGAEASRNVEVVTTTETLARAPAISGFNLKSPAGKCTLKGKIVGSLAGNPGTLREGTLTCTNFEVEETFGCTVGKVASQKVRGTLVWLSATGEEAGLKIAPEVGTETKGFPISGEECPLAGVFSSTGELIGSLRPVATEVIEGEFELPKVPKASCTTSSAISKWFNNEEKRKEQFVAHPPQIGTSSLAFCNRSNIWIEGKTVKFGVFSG